MGAHLKSQNGSFMQSSVSSKLALCTDEWSTASATGLVQAPPRRRGAVCRAASKHVVGVQDGMRGRYEAVYSSREKQIEWTLICFRLIRPSINVQRIP